MQTITMILAFLHSHTLETALTVLLGIEQALAAWPKCAANSTFQLITRATRGAMNELFPPKPDAKLPTPSDSPQA